MNPNFQPEFGIDNIKNNDIKKYRLLEEDILFSHINSDFHLGKTAIYRSMPEILLHGMNLLLIRANQNLIVPIYLHYLCNYYRIKGNFITIAQHAVNQSSINQKALKNTPIPLPPLPEQHRIVEKIEEEFTRLDAGVSALNKAKALIPRYRQAILKAAMCGVLTEEWRAEHPDVESAEVLLERKNKANKSNSGKKTNLFLIDNEYPYLLPDKWCWTKIGILSNLSSGIAFKRSEYSEEGIRLLQIANVTFGRIIWKNKAFLPEEYTSKYPRLLLKEGDLLMALNRPIINNKLKIALISKQDAPAILYQRVGRFDLYFPKIRKFLFYFLQSPQFIFKLDKELQGVDQPFINKPKLLDTIIPLPPLPEQQEIVNEIERRFSVIDAVEQTVDDSLAKAERLRQSILKKAFEGRLVPQNPDDEPASVLLERIQAEKEQRAAEEKARKNELKGQKGQEKKEKKQAII